MSIQEQKITQEAIAANGVQSQADKLTGTTAQNKKVFDALVTAVVREKFNALLDELTGSGCAAQLGVATIPGFSASDIQTALEQREHHACQARCGGDGRRPRRRGGGAYARRRGRGIRHAGAFAYPRAGRGARSGAGRG